MPTQNNAETDFLQSPWKAFWFALENQKGKLFVMYLCMIIGNAGAYSIPYFLKLIVDRISAPGPAPQSFNDFLAPILLIFVVVIGQELFYRSGHVLESIIAVKAFDRITSSLYQTLLKRPAAYFEETFAGELSWRITQVGSATKFFIDSFPWEIGWPVVASIVTIFLLRIANIWLVVVFVVWLLLFLLLSYFFLRLHYRATKMVAKTYADLNGSIVDTLTNMPVVHAFGAQNAEYGHYRIFMDPALKAERMERRILIINKFHQGMSFVLLSISLTLTSIFLFIKGDLTVGNFIIVAATIPSFAGIIWNFGDIVIRSIRSYGEFKNALDSLNTTILSIQDGDQKLVLRQAPIIFNHVSFGYPGAPEKVFDNLNLEIMSGQKVGLVGRSGAGKSTLIKLLLRSYDSTTGSIRIGAQDITEVTIDSLRDAISFVPQDTTLFHRTLYENIIYAKPSASKAEVIDASKRAHAHDFIVSYPEGYDIMVGERGVKLSGGQRQRIAIARAMLKNSPLLILDEATSALDSESEEIVQKGLQELFQGRTTIAIAHRLSTLRSMDRIIVMDQGRIIEDGSPKELLAKKNGEFKRIWEHQKNGFV
ncbi:MAG: ABC transporter ATP-binding protein [Candidatus Uhrbacteria bacterium]|nr:ABC transporter ATP-binding protein [Candidatus Uhrbacteria bacterium]